MPETARDVDALVAKHIMNWTCSDDNAGWGKEYITVCDNYDNMCDEHCPNYSTDIAAAWEVLENHTWPKIRFDQVSAVWECEVCESSHLSIQTGKLVKVNKSIGRAESAPMAICLAALKAKGVEIDEITK